MIGQIYRQGDVLLRRVAEIHEGAQASPRDAGGRLVLAQGEATGHAHVIIEPDAELLTVADQTDRWLRLRSRAVLTHEEHAAIALPRGIYRVTIQREWSDADEPQAVLD